MKKFTVTVIGRIQIDMEYVVEAETKKEARQMARRTFEEDYIGSEPKFELAAIMEEAEC